MNNFCHRAANALCTGTTLCILDDATRQQTPRSGADQGYPVGGGSNLRGGGAPTYDFAKFYEKLHEIEKILGRRGACAGGAPPKSATEDEQ